MPPHPALLAQIIQERNNVHPSQRLLDDGVPAPAQSQRLSAPTGSILGLNDGTIFPESHFVGDVSMRSLSHRMSSAALERAPLRGAIRYLTTRLLTAPALR
jgi:hypothetical protein